MHNFFFTKVFKQARNLNSQVIATVGGLAALVKKDSWQARVHLTLTYHVIGVLKKLKMPI